MSRHAGRDERHCAGLGTRDHYARATGRVVADHELRALPCRRPHRRQPAPAALPFRTLSRKYKIEGLAEALAEGLSTGHPDMPDFVFAPEDVGAIIDYLQSIQQQ